MHEPAVSPGAQETKNLGEAMRRLLEPSADRREDPSPRPPGSVRYEVMVFVLGRVPREPA